MLIKGWENLKFFETGEWQVIEERFAEYDAKNIMINPRPERLFYALECTPFDKVKVCMLAQDPYPGYQHAMGLAFSVPGTVKKLPESLKIVFKEYCEDLKYPYPKNGNLKPWTKQGVLLWNCIPSCFPGKSL